MLAPTPAGRKYPAVSPRDLALGLALIVALLVAYWPSMHGGMLIDDEVNITKPELRSLDGLARIWTEPSATQQYYPVLHSVFWFQHKLWGDAMFGYHLVNVAWHALASLLLVAVVRRLALPGAWLAGFLFALHPVCVESVAWVAEQKNTLSQVFYLAAALAYLRFDETRDSRPYKIASAFFVLALLSKPVTVTLPAALLVVFWWKRGKIEWARDAKPLLPWFAVGIGFGLFCTWVEHQFIGAKGADFDLSLIERLLVAGRAFWFYVGKLLWPSDLLFIYPRWSPATDGAWQYLPLVAALLAAAGLVWLARRRRGPLAAFLIFAGTLLPMLGFLNIYWFVFSFVADHFAYTPAVAFFVVVAAGATAAFNRLPLAKYVPALGASVVAALGVATWQRTHVYASSESVCRDTLARNPECWIFHNNLGVDLASKTQDYAAAVARFEEALRLRPTFSEGYYNLATTFEKMPGRVADAITAYEAAIRLRADYTDAHYNLGTILLREPNRVPEAVAHFEAAIARRPEHAEARLNLGNLLAQHPTRQGEALAHFEAALKSKPDLVEAHNSLGNLLLQMPGRTAEAIGHFETALRLNPSYAEAHCNLASAYLQTQQLLPEAIEHLQAALKLRPDFLEAHFNLGCALADSPGRRQEAIDRFALIVHRWPDCEPAREALAQLRNQ